MNCLMINTLYIRLVETLCSVVIWALRKRDREVVSVRYQFLYETIFFPVTHYLTLFKDACKNILHNNNSKKLFTNW